MTKYWAREDTQYWIAQLENRLEDIEKQRILGSRKSFQFGICYSTLGMSYAKRRRKPTGNLRTFGYRRLL